MEFDAGCMQLGCLNGGSCVSDVNSFGITSCICFAGYTGNYCQIGWNRTDDIVFKDNKDILLGPRLLP
jgi:hypothetical protein